MKATHLTIAQQEALRMQQALDRENYARQVRERVSNALEQTLELGYTNERITSLLHNYERSMAKHKESLPLAPRQCRDPKKILEELLATNSYFISFDEDVSKHTLNSASVSTAAAGGAPSTSSSMYEPMIDPKLVNGLRESLLIAANFYDSKDARQYGSDEGVASSSNRDHHLRGISEDEDETGHMEREYHMYGVSMKPKAYSLNITDEEFKDYSIHQSGSAPFTVKLPKQLSRTSSSSSILQESLFVTPKNISISTGGLRDVSRGSSSDVITDSNTSTTSAPVPRTPKPSGYKKRSIIEFAPLFGDESIMTKEEIRKKSG